MSIHPAAHPRAGDKSFEPCLTKFCAERWDENHLGLMIGSGPDSAVPRSAAIRLESGVDQTRHRRPRSGADDPDRTYEARTGLFHLDVCRFDDGPPLLDRSLLIRAELQASVLGVESTR